MMDVRDMKEGETTMESGAKNKRTYLVDVLDATMAYGDPVLIVRLGADALRALGVVRASGCGYADLPRDREKIIDKLQDALRTFDMARRIVDEGLAAFEEVESLLENVRENLRMYGEVRELGSDS